MIVALVSMNEDSYASLDTLFTIKIANLRSIRLATTILGNIERI